MTAIELRDIIANQLRTLNVMEVSDKHAQRKVETAKQVFNGAGKMIALAAYVDEAHRIGAKGDVLALPDNFERNLATKA